MSVKKIVIVDDHSIVRLAIRTIISNEKGYSVAGEAKNGKEALDLIRQIKPDVVLLDISMPEMDGIELTTILKKELHEIKVLILTMHEKEDTINKLINCGADGYLLKNLSRDDLINGIEAVLNGNKYFSDSISNILIDGYLNKSKASENGSVIEPEQTLENILTRREKDIVKLIIKGYTSKEIGDALFISPRTVETHRSNLLQKLKLKNTAELAKLAAVQGFGED